MISQIKSLKNDDLDCFKEVYIQYHTKLYNYLYSRTQSSYLSQDIVQSSFVKLWENRTKLSEEYSLEVQLFRIAKTLLIDEFRRDNVKGRYIDRAVNSNEKSYEDEQITDRDTLRHVFAEIENLPPIRKKVFKLSRIQNYSYKEIAEQLGISPKTVENHIAKALKQLRNALHVFLL